MSGSFIDAGLVYARVIHVGADNYVARINNEAKYVKQVNSEIMNALNAIVRFASVLLVPIGLALLYSSVQNSYQSWCALDPNSSSTLASWVASGDSWGAISSAILSTVGALLGMIPQGLVLLTSSVLAIATIRLARRKVLAQQLYCIETLARATIRLARRKVLAQQLYCIETLARVDVLCLDKTGTITSGHMEVEGVYVADDLGGVAPAEDFDAGHIDPASQRMHAALSGIARATSDDANETCTAVLAHYRDLARAPEAQRVIRHDHLGPYGGRGRVCGRRPRRGRARGGFRRRPHRSRVAADACRALWHRPRHVGRCERDLHGGPCALSRPRQRARGPARRRLLLW